MSEPRNNANEAAPHISSVKGRLSERVARRTSEPPTSVQVSTLEPPVATSAHILLVDPNPTNARILSGLLQLSGHRVTLVSDPEKVLSLAQRDLPRLLMIDSQLAKRHIHGLCTAFKEQPTTSHVPISIIADRYNRHDHQLFMQAGADDYCCVAADYRQLEARVATLLQNDNRDPQTSDTARAVHALLRAITARDPTTGNHLQRTGSYTMLLGRHLGLSGVTLTTLHYGALLHDIGKIGIDDAVLNKATPLSRAESHQVQQHPLIGERIVQPLQLGAAIAPIVRSHHELWDGSGYPDGLRGTEIPLGARVVAVADAFDSLTAARPGLTPLSTAAALEHLRAGAGKRWDAQLVAALQSGMHGE